MDNKRYSRNEILKAGELGELCSIDINHLCTLLDVAKNILDKGFDCYNCRYSTKDNFKKLRCINEYDINNSEDCNGLYYEKII